MVEGLREFLRAAVARGARVEGRIEMGVTQYGNVTTGWRDGFPNGTGSATFTVSGGARDLYAGMLTDEEAKLLQARTSDACKLGVLYVPEPAVKGA